MLGYGVMSKFPVESAALSAPLSNLNTDAANPGESKNYI